MSDDNDDGIKSILDFSDWVRVDGTTVQRPVLHPVTWHDARIVMTEKRPRPSDNGLCEWVLPKCDVCAGTETSLQTGERCVCRGLRARADRLSNARIPWAYSHCDVSHLVVDGGQRWVADYKEHGEGLRFIGRTGRGKTHRMLCAVRGLCERGITVRYVSWSLWLKEMRMAMGRDDEMAMLRARVERPAVVAIDDIGRERDTDWAQSELDVLLEQRTLAKQTVLLATNFTDEQLEYHLGDRLWSRLQASTRPVVCNGKDWRAK